MISFVRTPDSQVSFLELYHAYVHPILTLIKQYRIYGGNMSKSLSLTFSVKFTGEIGDSHGIICQPTAGEDEWELTGLSSSFFF